MTSPAPVNVPEKSLVKLAFLAAGCEELQKKGSEAENALAS